MHDINWWLMVAGFALGLLLTFAFMIRRVKVEVPVSEALRRGTAGAAKFIGGTAAATTGGAAAKLAGGRKPYGVGSAPVGAGGSGPAGWTIKGNEGSMLYHTPTVRTTGRSSMTSGSKTRNPPSAPVSRTGAKPGN